MVRSEHWKSFALLIASIVFALLLGELLVRAFGTDAARWRPQNFVVDPSLGDSRLRTMQPHPLLGYVPRSGYRWVGSDGRSVTFDDEGFRQHHALDPAPANGEPLLVTGDSYAMGEEVSDDETIPAHLEQTLGRPVINAGVSGYGLDQVVLRSEALVPRLRPAALVVTFIADDVWRAAQRILWGVPKPYFEIADGTLVLHDEPVPRPADRRLDPFRRVAGYSFLVHTVMRRLGLTAYWYRGQVQHVEPSGADGGQVACLLMQRLAQLADTGVRVMVVAEYTPQAWPGQPYHRAEEQVTRPVLACARDAGLQTVDVLPALAAEVARVGIERLYRAGHMSDIGNRVVAEQIAGRLGQPL
ncbi:MAG: hypothetical protein J0J01_08725 [Reyranella sp.]|uniref:SGNH/GDSL hydrolase family protein n=1 Tax=Reyranella sp. TaxID=1929291 RepID=UPI001ACDB644|nr:hypothetical protein [Reyranella sp.]MBN9086977.1 hypothetical protein [Reyranella sp.]